MTTAPVSHSGDAHRQADPAPSSDDALRIRAATPGDLERIIAWHGQTWSEHRARQPFYFSTGEDSLDGRKSALRSAVLANPGSARPTFAFIATVGGETVGYLVFQPRPTGITRKGKPAGRALIYDLFVTETHRRQGVARKLLRHGTAHLQDQGVQYFDAVVWGANTASAALFDAAGFSQVHSVHGLADPALRSLDALPQGDVATPWWRKQPIQAWTYGVVFLAGFLLALSGR